MKIDITENKSLVYRLTSISRLPYRHHDIHPIPTALRSRCQTKLHASSNRSPTRLFAQSKHYQPKCRQRTTKHHNIASTIHHHKRFIHPCNQLSIDIQHHTAISTATTSKFFKICIRRSLSRLRSCNGLISRAATPIST